MNLVVTKIGTIRHCTKFTDFVYVIKIKPL